MNRLKKERLDRKLSMNRVSIDTGLSRQLLINLENGAHTNPTLKTMKILSRYYGIPTEELFNL